MAGASLVPHLVVNGGSKAVEFYKAALGAEAARVVPEENGPRLMHAELHVGGDKFFLCDDFPEYCGGKARSPAALGGTGVTIHLSVPNCDEAVSRMAAAGGTVVMPPWDAFWGDRYAKVLDPFGHEWSFSHPLAKAA